MKSFQLAYAEKVDFERLIPIRKFHEREKMFLNKDSAHKLATLFTWQLVAVKTKRKIVTEPDTPKNF